MSLASSLRGLVVRAVARISGDGEAAQQAQLSGHAGQTRQAVEILHPYGFTGHAPAGGVTLLIHPNGDQSDPVALPPSHAGSRRQNLIAGQVCVYDAFKTEILLGNDGTITIKAATKIRLETPLLEVTGEIKDRAEQGGVSMSEMRQVFDGHTHPENDERSRTDPPTLNMGGH